MFFSILDYKTDKQWIFYVPFNVCHIHNVFQEVDPLANAVIYRKTFKKALDTESIYQNMPMMMQCHLQVLEIFLFKSIFFNFKFNLF